MPQSYINKGPYLGKSFSSQSPANPETYTQKLTNDQPELKSDGLVHSSLTQQNSGIAYHNN